MGHQVGRAKSSKRWTNGDGGKVFESDRREGPGAGTGPASPTAKRNIGKPQLPFVSPNLFVKFFHPSGNLLGESWSDDDDDYEKVPRQHRIPQRLVSESPL